MEVSYIKDIRHNYLVVSKKDEKADEAYCVRMLEANSIGGIIKPENRIIDGQTIYYYEITSKQALDIIYAKSTISYERIKKLFNDLLEIITDSYEYLLNPNDLVIDPEHIYIELSTKQAYICYLPGYNRELMDNMIKLIEYIMNKLEYKDKEAVLYVYNLYSVCRKEGASFNDFCNAVKKDKQEGPRKIEARKDKQEEPRELEARKVIAVGDSKLDDYEIDNKRLKLMNEVPLMMEKISDETEEYYYPIKAYIYTGISALLAIFILYLSFFTRIIYTSLGNRVDYSKMFALVLILFCSLGYIMKKIWARNMRLTRIVSRERYVDPRKEEYSKSIDFVKQDISTNQSTNKENTPAINKNNPDQSDENMAKTVLLNGDIKDGHRGECCLKPESEEVYEPIWICEFPYVIGKQKDNVDYYLDKDVVSRYHAKITKEGEKYYITDLNSTNGTYLNDTPLPCYQRYEINQGDVVAIAGIKYKFKTA